MKYFKLLGRNGLLGLGSIYLVLIYVLSIIESQNPDSNIKSITDALWYTVVTLTTVGYGDFYPVTGVGKIIGLLIILSSLGLMGYLIGKITNLILQFMEKKREGYYGVDFQNHFIVIGWDDFSKKVVDQLIYADKQVVVVANSKDTIDVIEELYGLKKVFVLYTDYKHYESYQKVNIEQAQKVFVNFSDDSELLVFTINLKKHYSDLKIMISLDQPDLKETFLSIGVTDVVSRNDIAAKLVASYIFEPDVAHFTDDLISTATKDNDYDILQYKVIDSNPFNNVKYIDAFMELKVKYNGVLVGLVQDSKLLKNPPVDTIIKEGDYILLISNHLSKKEIEAQFGVREGVN